MNFCSLYLAADRLEHLQCVQSEQVVLLSTRWFSFMLASQTLHISGPGLISTIGIRKKVTRYLLYLGLAGKIVLLEGLFDFYHIPWVELHFLSS